MNVLVTVIIIVVVVLIVVALILKGKKKKGGDLMKPQGGPSNPSQPPMSEGPGMGGSDNQPQV
ncbi:MAG: hypothetical protein PHW31_02380 [Candidatus Pacebacteria bacterium]|nr:hypothetical protein [Candidatus Paceibacterota bacterium]